ncbi:MAG: TMEM175 family protein [Thermoplasmata archaeon]
MAGDEELPAAPLAHRQAHRGVRGVSGDDLDRILALSDGVFAFAMTLLALSLVVPVVGGSTNHQVSGNLLNALGQDWNRFLGYTFAFVMIAVWWVAHNRTFQYIAHYDATLVWVNMAILLQIAIMPFVLSVYGNYSDTQTAVDLFAGIQVTLGISVTGLWDYARRARLIKTGVPIELTRYFSRRGWFTSAIFLTSIGISFVSITGAELSWIAVFVVTRFLDRYPG